MSRVEENSTAHLLISSSPQGQIVDTTLYSYPQCSGSLKFHVVMTQIAHLSANKSRGKSLASTP